MNKNLVKKAAIPFVLSIVLTGSILPAGCNTGFSHQPSSVTQMKMLVTPDDPAVIQTLKEILAQPIPEVTQQNFFTTFSGYYQDFNRIIDWAGSNIKDVSDQTTHGVADYWQLPSETLALGTGDCEDYAIVLCSLLRAYGVPADSVFVAVGKTDMGIDHAWLDEDYYKGAWRMIDRGDHVLLGGLEDIYSTNLYFNDLNGSHGKPGAAKGSYPFELGFSSYPLSPASINTPAGILSTGAAAQSWYRDLKAGQGMTATIDWLPDSVYSTYNSLPVYPWTVSIYDRDGNKIFTQDSTDVKKTVEFTPAFAGTYEIEVLKRDNLPRSGVVTIDPEGWKIQKPSDLFHNPNPGAVEALGPNAVQLTPEPTPQLPNIDRNALTQFVLDLVNKDRTGGNVAPLTLGNNTSAQAHADDMVNYQYFSRWGTDGADSAMRYTLGGGMSYSMENDYAIKIAWGGGTAGDLENILRSALEQAEAGLMKQTSTFSDPQGKENILYKWNKKVNLGIAYDSDYIFLVEQFEGESIVFSQAPTIQNGILSFSGSNIPGFTIDNNVLVEYDRPMSGLNPAQLNNAVWDTAPRIVAMVSQTKPYIAVSVTQYFQYTNPHSVPLNAPSPAIDPDAGAEPISNLAEWPTLAATTWDVGGTTFSISADLNQVVSRFGAGCTG
jgi:predicted transglutaminase-like cysteine proteinase